ncbi:DUF3015 family protein [Vibrio nigripulchritudo]|uniref:DUF3015 family protein n=1 Tax=Vibrio nigripulchritudo TaxID=28173 RepID=UPI0003B1DD43|nr:DUF3015 family protein [Vibrio nigripulchritudo]CCN73366.1 conserved hypothetical protein [Vibrio nigripulchritudo SFn118]
MKRILLAFTLMLSASVSHASYLKECGTGHFLAGGVADGWVAVSVNISSSTSDASSSYLTTPSLCGMSLWAAAKFIDSNYPMLEQDTATGNGEHVVAMLDILECDAAARADITTNLRGDFQKFIAAEGYKSATHEEKVESYFGSLVTSLENTSGQCQAV